MKLSKYLFDGGASVLIIIGIVYFIDWSVKTISPPPPQCYYQKTTQNGEVVGRWTACKPEDLHLGKNVEDIQG